VERRVREAAGLLHCSRYLSSLIAEAGHEVSAVRTPGCVARSVLGKPASRDRPVRREGVSAHWQVTDMASSGLGGKVTVSSAELFDSSDSPISPFESTVNIKAWEVP
jgi:hypothetical protein